MKRLIAIIIACALVGCLAQLHPLPAGAQACGSDWDCGSHSHCAFAGVDTRARCVPGSGGDRWSY